jgi:hypothetical protein
LSCRFSFRDFWATFLPSFLGFEAPFIVTSRSTLTPVL